MKRNSHAIEINLLGAFGLRVAGKPVSFPYQKPKLLLAYLVTEARTVSRADGAALLWPDRSEHHSRQNLRQAMAALKRPFGESFDRLFATSRQSIEFIGHESCAIDIELLKGAVKSPAIPRSAGEEPSLQSLYKGPFCMGFHVPGGTEFNEWLQTRQQEYHSLAMTLGRQRVNRYRETQQDQQAIQGYAQLLTLEWNNESLIEEFMKYLAGLGQRLAAIRLFQEYEKRLQENGQQPGEALLALQESIAATENARRVDLATLG